MLRPLEVKVIRATDESRRTVDVGTFTSYEFDMNMLVPASAFRFTANGVSKEDRLAIRSGDTSMLYARNVEGREFRLATGFIDETEFHLTAKNKDYLLTGRDTLGQLIDNSAIDASNNIIHLAQASVASVANVLLQNTRMPKEVVQRNAPSGPLLFQTNPGETKINALQRYLEYTNCLVWALPDGRMAIGKPNMSQSSADTLAIRESDPRFNNVLEIRVKRAPALAIRTIAVQVQELGVTDPGQVTVANSDADVALLAKRGVGRSVYRLFSQGNGTDAVNQLNQVGGGGGLQSIGKGYALREIARDNIKTLEVTAVLRGHIDNAGNPYAYEKMYDVIVEDEDLQERMYCYACKYSYTKEQGPTTTLRLCRTNALVADVPQRSV